MKLKVPKNTLDKAIKSVAKAVPSKGVQPILNNILLQNQNGHLRLNATDLDFTIEATIPSENEQEGSITISAKKLEEIVSRLDEDDIYINVDPSTNKANLTCKSSNFDLVGIPADDFPKLDKPDTSSFITIDKNTFAKIINMVYFSASRYDVNNILGGVLFCFKEENGKQIFEVVATDGNRLSDYEYVIEDNQNINLAVREAVVPLRVITDVQRILETSVDDNIKLSFLNNQIIFFTQDRFVVSRLVEGTYPRYKQLIPENNDREAEIDRKAFLSCLERVATMANEITNLVKLTFKDGSMFIESSNQDFGQAADEIQVEYSGDPIEIFFNIRYLIEPFKHMECAKIKMFMSGSVNPAVIRSTDDDNYIHLVMPIKHES